MPTVADTNELDNSKYKVVEKGVFVFSGMQTGRDVCIRIALFDEENPVIISCLHYFQNQRYNRTIT